jgi:hypothetical protein
LIGIDIFQQSSAPLILVKAKDVNLVERHLLKERFHHGEYKGEWLGG